MVRKFAVISILMLSLAAFAQQPAPVVQAQANTLFVGADGKFEAAPDTAVVQFNILGQEKTARAASERASKAADQVREILRNNGIDPSNAQIGYFSVEPWYDYGKFGRKPAGYHVHSSVTVKVKDFSKIAPITEQLADMAVTDSTFVNYTLDKMEDAKVRAVQDAYQHAKTEASALATAAGRTLGELSYASVDVQEQVRPMPMPYLMNQSLEVRRAAAQQTPVPQDFTPQQITVTAHVNAMFALK